jgi:nitroimidazol reductase NimA-like FMN-containing flavoprotein (pyridoxamine 5'-phosphate oxidase superfamily)
MDEILKQKITEILHQNRIMTIATNRPDGWPQATTVGYVNVGLTLYFLCGAQSQKAENIARDQRISLTIDHDISDPMAIKGLSMAAEAQLLQSPAEISKAMSLFPSEYEFRAMDLDEVLVFRVVAKVISVLDYSIEFGHADLITICPDDAPNC